MKTWIAASVFATMALANSAQAQNIHIDFDTIATGATVDSYYAGGTDSVGETGPNYGVTFTAGDWNAITDFGETSQPNFAYSASGQGSFDVANGFTGAVNFTYGAFTDTVITLYSGVGGTGSVLASAVASANDPSAFSSFSLSFGGTAHSFVISGGTGQFGFDDLDLRSGAAPEPASWAMMLGGFGLVGGAMRARRKVAVSFG